MKKKIISVCLALVLAVSPAATAFGEEIIIEELSDGESSGNSETAVPDRFGVEDTAGDLEILSQDVVMDDVSGSDEGTGSGLAETSDGGVEEPEDVSEPITVDKAGDENGLLLDIQQVESGEYASGDEAFEIIEEEAVSLGESGLASDAFLSRLRSGVAEYNGCYGNQLSGDSAKIYQAFVTNYAEQNNTAAFEYELSDPLTFSVFPEKDSSGKTNWNLDKNEEYIYSIQPRISTMVQSAYDAFIYDHPEVFWMGTPKFSWSVACSGNIATGTGIGTIRSLKVVPAERYTGAASEISAFNQAVDSVANTISASLTESASQYNKVKAIHDWICNNVSYGENAYAHTAAGVFIKKRIVVCEGYAKAFKILCGKFGIESVLIPGNALKADGSYEGHMWNYVKMENGNWYMVDATWNDQSGGVTDTYFLAGSTSIGFTGKQIGEERVIFDNFSSSENSQRFGLPGLFSKKYEPGSPAAPHVHKQFIKEIKPNCGQDGYTIYGCTECDWTMRTEQANAGAHDFINYVSNNDATCTADGTKTGTCSRCGAKDTVTDPGSALGHSFTAYVTDKNATCTEDGTKTRTCSRCGAKETVTDPDTALGHSFTKYVADKNATCTADGTKTAICDRCKKEKQTVKDQGSELGHKYGAYVSDKNATALKDGTKTRTCARCGKKETVTDKGSKLPATIKLNATSLTLKTGQTTTALKVTGLAKGDSIKKCKSADTSKVKVTLKSGKITLQAQKKTGKTSITITLASGLTKKVSVTVQKATVETKKITGLSKKVTLEKGKKTTLKPVLSPITSTEKITYSTSDKKVATVSPKGVVTAKGAGTAKITVKSGSKKATVTVTVKKTATTKLTGVPKSLTLKKGKSTTLKPKRTPANSDEKITYKTSNKKVATVSSKGKITAKKKGTATITVTSGKITAKCKVTVK